MLAVEKDWFAIEDGNVICESLTLRVLPSCAILTSYDKDLLARLVAI